MTQPNILILMADQVNGLLFPDGPADFLHAPNLRALAERSTRFVNAYTPSPLCAPARASLMTGLLPYRSKVYDNGAEFASDLPTYAHHLRRAGYQTTLSGKMHFVGPDQLHGFEERLTTDVYPADFGWTPDYTKPDERIDWWYHNLGSVTTAGTAEITNQLEYDDEVVYNATRKLYDLARGNDQRPWCLTVSFTHPHDPYVARPKYWHLYDDCLELVAPPAIPYDDQDPHSRRLLDAADWRNYDINDEDIRHARQGYFANISYVDEKIGELLGVLEATGQEAVVVVLSDHGDMLGERGMWFKMSHREGSARVPLMISSPQMAPGRVDTPVSIIDVVPTVCELAGVPAEDVAPWIDGESLVAGADGHGPVALEYAAEGTLSPMVGLRDGDWKYIRTDSDPEQLFDLVTDPAETTNLAQDPAHADQLDRLRGIADEQWDLAAYDRAVRESQARRLVIYEALRQGAYHSWDFQPIRPASEQYMRNHHSLDGLEDAKRVPAITDRAAAPPIL